MTFKGLTWDHPRGRRALEAKPGPIEWSVQPLEGFESASISENCAKYDLVVLDHPHLGEALDADCLIPLHEVFDEASLQHIQGEAIGASFSSYMMDGKLWALPLDAATQVMALRADLVDQIPQSWAELQEQAARGVTIGLSLAGPHAALSFLSMAHGMDENLALGDGSRWVPRRLAIDVIELMAEFTARSPKAISDLNPIGILEFMSQGDGLAICPLIYGYVNYAQKSFASPIAFHDTPAFGSSGRLGSILGGTGIAISARCNVNEALKKHLLWLLHSETQMGFIPIHEGQPSARSAWLNKAVNEPVNDFYINTQKTTEQAVIRPRYDGYIAFQSAASARLRMGLELGSSAQVLAEALENLFEQSQE